MSHTETQARELWCPMVRIARHEVVRRETAIVADMKAISEDHHIVAGCNTDALGGNRVPASCRCIASDCAMWRWEMAPEVELYRSGPGKPIEKREIPGVGYCGLAMTGVRK